MWKFHVWMMKAIRRCDYLYTLKIGNGGDVQNAHMAARSKACRQEMLESIEILVTFSRFHTHYTKSNTFLKPLATVFIFLLSFHSIFLLMCTINGISSFCTFSKAESHEIILSFSTLCVKISNFSLCKNFSKKYNQFCVST